MPKIWNSIPLHTRQSQSHTLPSDVILRRTTLFQPISPPCGPCNAPWFSSETLALYKSLTYLLTYKKYFGVFFCTSQCSNCHGVCRGVTLVGSHEFVLCRCSDNDWQNVITTNPNLPNQRCRVRSALEIRCVGARTTHSFCRSFCCVRSRGCVWRSLRMATLRWGHCWTQRARPGDCLHFSHITTTNATWLPAQSVTGRCGLCVSAKRRDSTWIARTQSSCTPSGILYVCLFTLRNK